MFGNRSKLKKTELSASDKEKEGRQARQDVEAGAKNLKLSHFEVAHATEKCKAITKVEGLLVNA